MNVQDGWKRRGWCEVDLTNRPKSLAAKLAIVARLRKGTTLNQQIASGMNLRTSKSANARLHNWMGKCPAPDPM